MVYEEAERRSRTNAQSGMKVSTNASGMYGYPWNAIIAAVPHAPATATKITWRRATQQLPCHSPMSYVYATKSTANAAATSLL